MSFFRKAFLVNVTALVSFVIRLIQTVVLTRWLGPTGIGQYAVVCSAVMLGSQIAAFGYPMAFLYYSQHDPKQTRVYQTHTIWSGLILGLLGGALLGGLVKWLPSYFGSLPWYGMLAVSLYAVCRILAGVGQSSLLQCVESKRISLMSIASSSGSLALVGGLALADRLTVGSALLCPGLISSSKVTWVEVHPGYAAPIQLVSPTLPATTRFCVLDTAPSISD